ncbi:hypothetical protein [Kiloniella majae]|uniref:hypothetical protein n=1 Tax=Kiloniella majae TaxID=1938558 RepID=UPI000A2782ED|nr:hypothetical protein [Kiloniella majae]
MGCDIHIVVEMKREKDTKWTGVVATDFLKSEPAISCRDYDFFAEVANVRGSTSSGNYPKDLPEDISDLAWKMYMRSPTDHHSASYMDLKEFCLVHHKINPNLSREDFCVSDLAGYFYDYEDTEYRAVFWFDN